MTFSFDLKLSLSNGKVLRVTIDVPALSDFTFEQLCQYVAKLAPSADLSTLSWIDEESEIISLDSDAGVASALRNLPRISGGDGAPEILRVYANVPQLDSDDEDSDYDDDDSGEDLESEAKKPKLRRSDDFFMLKCYTGDTEFEDERIELGNFLEPCDWKRGRTLLHFAQLGGVRNDYGHRRERFHVVYRDGERGSTPWDLLQYAIAPDLQQGMPSDYPKFVRALERAGAPQELYARVDSGSTSSHREAVATSAFAVSGKGERMAAKAGGVWSVQTQIANWPANSGQVAKPSVPIIVEKKAAEMMTAPVALMPSAIGGEIMKTDPEELPTVMQSAGGQNKTAAKEIPSSDPGPSGTSRQAAILDVINSVASKGDGQKQAANEIPAVKLPPAQPKGDEKKMAAPIKLPAADKPPQAKPKGGGDKKAAPAEKPKGAEKKAAPKKVADEKTSLQAKRAAAAKRKRAA